MNGKVKIELYEWKCVCGKKLISLDKEKLEEKIKEHLKKCETVKKAEELRQKLSMEDIRILEKILLLDEFERKLKRLIKKYGISKEELLDIVEVMEW